MAIKPLYVYRPLLNGQEVAKWATAQGFDTTLKPAEMHVTIAYSKEPVDWTKFTPNRNSLIVLPRHRQVAILGDKGAVVLKFQSANLANRWAEFKRDGASWDYDGYKPHMTITYNLGQKDIGEIRPFTGDLVFGPECFEPIDEDAVENLVEKKVVG